MKTRRSLPRLTSWILRHVVDCRCEVGRIPLGPRALLVPDLSFPLIELHNAIATFLRCYCLSSLAGAYTANGSRVKATPPIHGHRSALTFAIRTERPNRKGNGPWQHRDEPTWHDPNVIVRVLASAQSSNSSGVSSALSIGSEPIAHLTTTRNFLAHRSESTALKLRRLAPYYGVRAPDDPLAVLFASRRGRPQRIVEDWMDDIFTIFALFPR